MHENLQKPSAKTVFSGSGFKFITKVITRAGLGMAASPPGPGPGRGAPEEIIIIFLKKMIIFEGRPGPARAGRGLGRQSRFNI